MRPISIMLLAAAVMAAGGAAIYANRIVQARATEAAAAQRLASSDVEILVAMRELPQGHVLSEGDVKWDRWPLATANAAHVMRRESNEDPLSPVSGNAVRRNILAGEPIGAESLFTPGRNTGFMAGMVEPGMKAVGVTVTAASTASGFVLPGDLVDVILTVDLRKNEVVLPGGGRYASEIILRGVRVLAVDQTLSPSVSSSSTTKSRRTSSKKGNVVKSAQAADEGGVPEEMAMVGKTVALEVTPADGERLLAAQAAGTLSLALRSLALGEKEIAKGTFTSDVDTSRALRLAVGGGVKVIKGGEIVR